MSSPQVFDPSLFDLTLFDTRPAVAPEVYRLEECLARYLLIEGQAAGYALRSVAERYALMEVR